MSKVTTIDIGNKVNCDCCNANYTDSEAQGGLLFNGKAICPACAPDWEEGAARHGETQYITARAAEGQSFRAFVLGIRNGNNTIRIEEL